MKKIMVFVASALLGIAFLTACGSSDLMKNYTTLAEDFTETLYEDDYDGALAYVDATMQESITTDALTEIVTGTTSEYGAFQSVEGTEEISMSDYLEKMGISESESSALDSLDCTVVAVAGGFESFRKYLFFFFYTAGRGSIWGKV